MPVSVWYLLPTDHVALSMRTFRIPDSAQNTIQNALFQHKLCATISLAGTA